MLQDDLPIDLRQEGEKQTIKYMSGISQETTWKERFKSTLAHILPSPIPCQPLMGLLHIPGTHIPEHHVKAAVVSGCIVN